MVSAVVGLLVGAAGASGLADAASPVPSAAALLASSRAACEATAGVHVVVTISGRGGSLSEVLELGQTSASGQAHGSLVGGTSQIVVIDKTVYIKGDQGGLVNDGLSAAEAAKAGGRWIRLESGTSAYTQNHATLRKAMPELFPTAGSFTVRGPVELGGVAVWMVRGAVADGGTETAYIRSSGPPLLVKLTTSFGSLRGGVVETFSEWGESVAVTAPPNAIALSSL